MIASKIRAGNSRGQAVLESLVILPFLIITLGGFLLLGGLVFHKHWLLYNGQRALVCLAEGQSIQFCKTMLHKRISQSPIKTKIKLTKNIFNSGEVIFKSKVLSTQKFELARSLQWP